MVKVKWSGFLTLVCGTITSPATVSVDNQVSHRLTIAPEIERGQISRVI